MYFPQEEVEQVRPMHPIFRGATSQADSHLPLEPLKQKQRILSRSVEFESFDPADICVAPGRVITGSIIPANR